MFGHDLLIEPDTCFPVYLWKFRLPSGGVKSEIVRYADFVQFHAVVDFLENTSVERPTVIDVGAFHGSYAVILGKMVQKLGGNLIAVEPNPSSYEILKKNVRLNGLEDTVICESVGVSDKEGQLQLRTVGSESFLTEKTQGNALSIPVLTLRQIIERHSIRNVTLLLVDVEGAELCVLRGFPWESVALGRLFCELHPYNWQLFGYSGNDFDRFNHEHGFRVLDMYMHEHTTLDATQYLGPCLFLPSGQS